MPAKTQHDRGNCCAFCAAGHGGTAAIEPPALVFVSLQRQYQRVSWLEAAAPISTVRSRLERPSPRATAGGLTLFP